MPELNARFWNERYLQQQTGWDVGSVTGPLKEYIDKLTDKHMRICIPGCGNAYEAAYLLEKGFTDITLIDISPVVVEQVRQRFHGNESVLKVVCADFFDWKEPFDLILEQTFFCALDPVLRPAYAQQMHDLLRPGGILAGVLFNRAFEGGPPFGGSMEEYRSLFEPLFHIKTMEVCYNSIAPRKDAEAFIQLIRK
jgi:SAM-dependent methyltransferase